MRGSPTSRPTVIFAMLAEREVQFYIECAREIQARKPGTEVHFINFFEPAHPLIEAAGFHAHNFYQTLQQIDSQRPADEIFRDFGIAVPRPLLLHEKVTFDLNEDALYEKFARYLQASDQILTAILENASEATVFQELGGFVSILSVYFAAKKHCVRHVSFEPAFYRGRVLPVVNTLSTVRPTGHTTEIEPAALEYLRSALGQKTVVIPDKDKHHFRDMGVGKLVNSDNGRKIFKKVTDKYVRRKRFEFDHILKHSWRYLKMLRNRRRRSGMYLSDVAKLPTRFVYFPLHVELDYSLTIRSPSYFDQVEILNQIAKHLPEGVGLVAKEHPASIGGFSQKKIDQLVGLRKNFYFMHPSINSYELLDKSAAVITINSKVGAEALAARKKVFVLGDAFYADCPMIEFARDLSALHKQVKEFFRTGHAPDFSAYDRYFSEMWNQSFAGELYVNAAANVQTFVKGMEPFLPAPAKGGRDEKTARDAVRPL